MNYPYRNGEAGCPIIEKSDVASNTPARTTFNWALNRKLNKYVNNSHFILCSASTQFVLLGCKIYNRILIHGNE